MPDELLQRILCVLGDGGGGHQQEAEEGGVHGVTGVTLSRVVSVVTVSRVPLCIRWLACAWLYGHGMVPAPTGQRRWAQELYILDTDSASIIRPQSRSCAVSSLHCADHVTLT